MKICVIALSNGEIISNRKNNSINTLCAELYKNGQEVVSLELLKPNASNLSSSIKKAFEIGDTVLLLCENEAERAYMAKRVVCEVFNCQMVDSLFAKKNMEDYASQINVPLLKEEYSFSQMPQVARTIKNPNGVFQGCLCESGGKTLFMLPLATKEMEHMFYQSVMPYILQSRGDGSSTYVLKTFGITTHELQATLREQIKNKHNIEVVCNEYLKSGEVILHVPKSMRKDLVDEFIQTVYAKILPYVYADTDESMPEKILEYCNLHKLTLCFAEDFTCGNLSAKMFKYGAQSKDVLQNCVVVPSTLDKKKVLGVNENLFNKVTVDFGEIAYQMAVGAVENFGAGVAISCTGDVEEGILAFAIGNNDGIHVYSQSLEGTREQKIELATNTIFFELIKKLKQNDFHLGQTIL